MLKKICAKTGCSNLTTGRYCEDHQEEKYNYDQYRGSSAKRGYDYRWQKARKAYLRKHPLCKHCEENGRIEPATVIDHIIPHRGDKQLFWDRDNNWQPLCESCHNRKTARYDGGFGNKR